MSSGISLRLLRLHLVESIQIGFYDNHYNQRPRVFKFQRNKNVSPLAAQLSLYVHNGGLKTHSCMCTE